MGLQVRDMLSSAKISKTKSFVNPQDNVEKAPFPQAGGTEGKGRRAGPSKT
jgi:hypothetical protein